LSPLSEIEAMTVMELKKKVRKLNVKRNNGYNIHISN
jgi:predicted HTH domain antitoxin